MGAIWNRSRALMCLVSAVECHWQEKTHDARYNGLILIKIAGHQCPRTVHSGVSGIAAQFPQGTKLHQVTLWKGANA